MSRDRGVEARGRGETEAFENSFEARPRRGVGRPRGGLETEAPRPRPHPYLRLPQYAPAYCDSLQVVTRYTSYTHLDQLLTRYPCWTASTANQSGLVTLDLESGVRVTCDVGYFCGNFSLPTPLCYWLRPNVCDRHQTDVSQHHRSMPLPRGRRHNNGSSAECRVVFSS